MNGRLNTCPADLNFDGLVDDADFVLFAAAYNILDCQDPAMASGCLADLTVDGAVDDAERKFVRRLMDRASLSDAERLDVEEAFRFDMRLATAFCDFSIGRDFYTGVTHVLERDPATGKRRTGIAAWDPPSLDKVSDTQIRAQFFSDLDTARKAGLQMDVPELPSVPAPATSKEARQARDSLLRGKGPLRWEQSHNVFALPSEAECAALLEGNHPAAAAVTPDSAELIDCLKRHKGHLPGLEFKVADWIKRSHRSA